MCKIQIPEGATLDEKRSLCFDALYEMKQVKIQQNALTFDEIT